MKCKPEHQMERLLAARKAQLVQLGELRKSLRFARADGLSPQGEYRRGYVGLVCEVITSIRAIDTAIRVLKAMDEARVSIAQHTLRRGFHV